MVPTLRCGFVRSNFCFAIALSCYFPPGHSGGIPLLKLPLWSQRSLLFGAGAHKRTRTADLALTKGVLCQLSYVGGATSLSGFPPRKGWSRFVYTKRPLIIGRLLSGA